MYITKASGERIELYTEEEKEECLDMSLTMIARSLGYTPERCGSHYKLKEMDSLIIYNDRTWNRFSGKGDKTHGSQIDFVREYGGCSTVPQAINFLLSLKGVGVESKDFTPIMAKDTTNSSNTIIKAPTDYTEYYKKCHKALLESKEAMRYLNIKRRINAESIEHFNLGFDPCFIHESQITKPKEEQYPTPRIIIPRDKHTFQTRRISGEACKNMLQGSQKALFNMQCLKENDIIFVVEGEIDAISIYQLGFPGVIALGSLTNAGRFFEAAYENKEKVYIIAMDNDSRKVENELSPGEKWQSSLCELLQKENIGYVNTRPNILFLGKKDSNAAYIENADKYKIMLNKCKEEAERILNNKREQNLIKESSDCLIQLRA